MSCSPVASCPGIRIVYMSGYAGGYFSEEGVSSEGVTLLQKLFTFSALEEKIRLVPNPRVSS